MDDQTILDNKRGRESAHQVAELARLETIPMSAVARLRFWESLRDEVSQELPPQVSPRQMSADEIREFGKSTIPFGVHIGKRIDNIDLGYLDWLLGESSEFVGKLRQYLADPRIQAEREQ